MFTVCSSILLVGSDAHRVHWMLRSGRPLPEPKRRRCSLVGLGIPLAHVERILQALNDAGGEDLVRTSRLHMRNTLASIRAKVSATYEVNWFVWEFASIRKLMELLCAESRSLQQHISAVFADSPCHAGSPWRSLTYCDEVTPGNILAPDLNRKSMVWMFEIGRAHV